MEDGGLVRACTWLKPQATKQNKSSYPKKPNCFSGLRGTLDLGEVGQPNLPVAGVCDSVSELQQRRGETFASQRGQIPGEFGVLVGAVGPFGGKS